MDLYDDVTDNYDEDEHVDDYDENDDDDDDDGDDYERMTLMIKRLMACNN